MVTNNRVIYLTQGDTRPLLVFYLKNEYTLAPVDLQGATAKCYISRVGSQTLKNTLIGQLVVGTLNEDQVTVNIDPPYNLPGSGGGVAFPLSPTTTDTVGSFNAEVEITFADGGIATVYGLQRLKIRAQVG